jgi:hypothetical protein
LTGGVENDHFEAVLSAGAGLEEDCYLLGVWRGIDGPDRRALWSLEETSRFPITRYRPDRISWSDEHSGGGASHGEEIS